MNDAHILFVCNTLVGGGAEKQLLLTARGLAGQGIACRVYVLRPVPPDARYARLVEGCRLAGVRFVVPARRLWGVVVILRLCWDALRLSSSIIWTWGFRAEMIRILCPFLWSSPGVLALRSASEDEIRRHLLLLRCGKFLTYRYIANSRRVFDIVGRYMPRALSRSSVVYNALEGDLLTRSTRVWRMRAPVRIAMLGNVRFYVKGYDFALEFARRAQKMGLDIKIVIGGRQISGELSIREAIDAAGVGDIVDWVGGVSDIASFLEGADVFLLLSRYEGTSNSLLEAMALGLPCIAAAVGDVEDFAGQGAGIAVVSVGDVDAVIGHVQALMANSNLGAEMGRRNRLFCREKFSEATMVAETKSALFGSDIDCSAPN